MRNRIMEAKRKDSGLQAQAKQILDTYSIRRRHLVLYCGSGASSCGKFDNLFERK